MPYVIQDVWDVLKPENDFERLLLNQPELMRGLLSGEPRYGHPEGKVFLHVDEIFDNIERIPSIDQQSRQHLRLIAIVHDSFKHLEHKGSPRDWSRHHAVLAKEFLWQFTTENALLDITELHDEAYYCWRMNALEGLHEASDQRFNELLWRLQDNIQLYYWFFKCDTHTGDKTLAPVYWVEQNMPHVDRLPW